jgi:GR25 family glycosyltransferase involved in LPS biosynthesis
MAKRLTKSVNQRLTKRRSKKVVKSRLKKAEAYVISLTDQAFQTAKDNIMGLKDIPIKKFDAIRGSDMKKFVQDPKNVTVRGLRDLLDKEPREADRDMGSINAVGLAMGHYALWKKIVDENYEGMYIFESDVACEKQIKPSYIKNFLKKKNPHILFFGSFLFDDPDYEKFKSKVTGRFFETHAYYITKEGAEHCMKYFFPIDQQLDSYMSDLIILGYIKESGHKPLNCYNINVCFQDNPEGSSIQTVPVKSSGNESEEEDSD